ncbi:MAG: SDR family oxidoreductase [Elusimicrobia bacterium]|nr:SDR family oxidoreductase [Elusimicrobiota bacterium]
MSDSLGGKTALITGGSGGIGRAIARLFATEACDIALHYASNRAAALDVQARIRASGGNCELFRGDLLKPGAAASLVKSAVRTFGRLDVLVNNAGAVIGHSDFLTASESEWDKNLRLNAMAPFFLSREAFKHMRRSGGRIINVSSIAAKFGGSSHSMPYGAAKAAVEAMTVAMAREGARHGILVNAIRPGVIDTPFHDDTWKDMTRRISLIPLKRMGRPEDVARAALLLAGRGGDFITGQVFNITGGE